MSLNQVVLAVIGLAATDEVRTRARGLMEDLGAKCGVADLYKMHAGQVLKKLRASAGSWLAVSHDKLIFEVSISLSNLRYF